MTDSLKIKLVYAVSFIFLVVNLIAIIKNIYWLSLLPVVLFMVLLAIFALDKLILLIVFCTPLAINLQKLEMGFGISLPTEPLIFGAMMLFFIKLVTEGGFDRKILRHPVTIAIIINLLWMAITTASSTLPFISFKFVIARLWFVTVFYFLATQLFKRFENVKRFIWLYSIPLLGVIVYTTIRHWQNGFTEKAAHWVMDPFYNDHTAYAAAIAMFLPMIIAFFTNSTNSYLERFSAFFFFLVFLLAIVLSYTRAAWISLAVALVLYLILIFRIKLITIFLVAAAGLVLFFSFQKEIMMRLEKNNVDSSTDYANHVKSMANISTDASNLERINRWKSAMRMFKVKPFFGWGPGTYAFKYAPFQNSHEKTIISTNAGDKGTAHSEYIGPLAESGVLGLATFSFILICVVYTGVKLYNEVDDKNMRGIALGLLLGLITYYVHGALNNFLDTDKASVPFWGFIAALVTLDVYYKNKKGLKTAAE